MRNIVMDFIESTRAINTYRGLDIVLKKYLSSLGFSRFSYVARSLDGVPKNTFLVLRHTYPDEWASHYYENEYQFIDPVYIHGERDLLPFDWGGREFLKKLSKKQSILFEEAKVFDIRVGFTIPIHGSGGESATLNLLSDANQSEFYKLVDIYRHELHLISLYYHYKIKQIYFSKIDKLPSLTLREIECLTWVSKGYIYEEIAQKLNLSRSTIIYHIQNAKKKLGSKTINQAVAQAIHASIIKP